MTNTKKTTKTSPSKAPAQKTTEKGVAEKGAEKSAKAAHNHPNDGHEHKTHEAEGCCKNDDECCGGGCCDDGNDVMDAGEHGCGCGHEHDDEMAVPRTKVKPHKPNTSGIVEDGNIVVLHYTGTLDSGERFVRMFRLFPGETPHEMTCLSAAYVWDGRAGRDYATSAFARDDSDSEVTQEDYRVAVEAHANLITAPADFKLLYGRNEIALQAVHRSIAAAIGASS